MTYTEYKSKRQAEFNSLPIFWAFSKEQFRVEMEKRGLSEKDTGMIYTLGGGGYFLKSDEEIIEKFMNTPDELPSLMNDTNFAQSAFYYEMANHEYHINWQADYDVCSCFGDCEYEEGKEYHDYLKEMGYGDDVVKAYTRARRKFLCDADRNDWY